MGLGPRREGGDGGQEPQAQQGQAVLGFGRDDRVHRPLDQPVSLEGAEGLTMTTKMPTFTPADSVLVLIDHQTGTMQLIKNIPLEVVKRNTLALAKTAKILNIPVVLTSSQEENLQGPLMPEPADISPDAFAGRVKRAGIVNAWDDRSFVAAVEKPGRKNLIMAGVTTDRASSSPPSAPSVTATTYRP